MALSNSTVTHLLDPRVDNTQRTEFRLPEGMLSSSLKLADLGVYSTQLNDTTGWYYDAAVGVWSIIQKITLYSGSTVLDETHELSNEISVKTRMTTNQKSEDLARFDLLNAKNYQISESGAYSLDARNKDYYDKAQNAANTERYRGQIQIASAAEVGSAGSVMLSDCLEFLASVPVLPNLPELRLVIDWKTGAALQNALYQQPGTTAVAAPNFQHKRPTLIATEIMGVEMPEEVKIPYMRNFIERFSIPTAPAGSVVKNSFRSGALRNRYVKDLMLFNQFNGDYHGLRKASRCPVMRKEKIQLVLNGQKYLPDAGCDQAAMKAQYFNDTRGSLNSNVGEFYNPRNANHDLLANIDDSEKMAGNFAPFACAVNQKVDRLDIEYERKGYGTGAEHLPFTLVMFARCAAMLEVKNGQVRLSY